MNRHYIIDPQGQKHTRNSKGRTYTHAVVVLTGAKFLEARRPNIAIAKMENDRMWDRIENEAKGIFPKGEQWRGPKALASWQAHAVKWMTEHTREGDLAEAIAHANKMFKQRVESGEDLRYGCVGWAGRLDLAEKLAAAQRVHGFEDVRIIPAVR